MATESIKPRKLPPPGKKWMFQDLTGQTFHRLTVLSRDPQNDIIGGARWLVRCECGTEKVVRASHLQDGRTKSCGCWSRDQARRPLSRQVFLEHMFNRYRKAAAGRNIFWNLTVEQVDELLEGNCFYYGVEPRFRNATFRGNISRFVYNGIDRLANHLGYFPENCVSCCGVCNVAKQDIPLHQFMTWISRLTEHSRHANG